MGSINGPECCQLGQKQQKSWKSRSGYSKDQVVPSLKHMKFDKKVWEIWIACTVSCQLNWFFYVGRTVSGICLYYN